MCGSNPDLTNFCSAAGSVVPMVCPYLRSLYTSAHAFESEPWVREALSPIWTWGVSLLSVAPVPVLWCVLAGVLVFPLSLVSRPVISVPNCWLKHSQLNDHLQLVQWAK